MNTDPIFKQKQWNINTNNNKPLAPWLNNKIITKETLILTFKTFHTTADKLRAANTLINSYTNSLLH